MVTRTATLYFWKADFGLFKDLVERVPCEAVLKSIGVQEVQLGVNIATSIKGNKNSSINTLTTQEGLRRISILYWMGGGNMVTKDEERLRYLMPSLPQSLIVRSIVLSAPSPLSWKTES